MVEVRWTPQAADDLEAITNFIAVDSLNFASLFALDVLASVERLLAFPRMGRVVSELHNPDVREIILGNYRIVYRIKGDIAEILTVWHGARLLDPDRLR